MMLFEPLSYKYEPPARANFQFPSIKCHFSVWARLFLVATAHCSLHQCWAVEAVCRVLVPVPTDSLHGHSHFDSSVAVPVPVLAGGMRNYKQVF